MLTPADLSLCLHTDLDLHPTLALTDLDPHSTLALTNLNSHSTLTDPNLHLLVLYPLILCLSCTQHLCSLVSDSTLAHLPFSGDHYCYLGDCMLLSIYKYKQGN